MNPSKEAKYYLSKTFAAAVASLVLISIGIITFDALTAAVPAFADKGAVPNFGDSGQHLPTIHGKASCVHRTIFNNATLEGGNVHLVC